MSDDLRIHIEARITRFTVEGEPVAWQRVEKAKRGHSFMPGVVRRAERAVGAAYLAAGGRLLEGPVIVQCNFYLGGRAGGAHLDARDKDNLEKTVLDGLQRIAYPNDRRVVAGAQQKLMDAGRPRTEVVVTHLLPRPCELRPRQPRRALPLPRAMAQRSSLRGAGLRGAGARPRRLQPASPGDQEETG